MHVTWIPIAEMHVHYSGIGVGVLDLVIYAVDGHDGHDILLEIVHLL